MSASSSTVNLIKTKILKQANDLLTSCPALNQSSLLANNPSAPRVIKSIDDLKSSFYIHLFENICNVELENKRIPSKSLDDEIHNVQTLIDTLAEDILQEDLSHLNGELICNGDLASIEYLLDILRCINEWISSRLESLNSKSTTSQQQDEEKASSFSEIRNDLIEYDDSEQEATFDNDIWLQHLEHLNEFEQLHQELEMSYLSGSDVSSVNTSAFSYRPSKKIVTFDGKEQKKTQHKEPTTQYGKKLANLYLDDKENKPKRSFVKLNNCLPPSDLTTKSYIISTIGNKTSKPKGQLNPVQLFQDYKKHWKKQKAPGEKDHAELRWWIRAKMSEKPVLNQKPLSEINRQEWID